MTASTKHLWEIDHPYYMNEGNYFSNDCHFSFESFNDFFAEWGDADMDYNWVIRWDWLVDDNDDEVEGWVPPSDRKDTDISGILKVQIVGQRKAKLQSCSVRVCRLDETRVREYLSGYAAYMAQMWEGFDLSLKEETA